MTNAINDDFDQFAFGITWLGGKVHERITKEAALRADMPYGNMIEGVKWPDAPSDDPNKVSYWSAWRGLEKPGTAANDSHHGDKQYWHSMAPDDGTGKIYTNGEVKELIINKAVEWYENAQNKQDTFDLGKVLHMVQDSYSRSHVTRDENGRVKNFQSYNAQDAHEHGTADKPHLETSIDNNGIERQMPQDWREIPGTLQALEASTAILKLYKSGASAMELANYLRNNVYKFENEQTKDLPAGGTDPQFAPKPKTRISENQTFRELLTQHHGADNAEKIIANMQANLTEALQLKNSAVQPQITFNA